jgi:hypothetical protein
MPFEYYEILLEALDQAGSDFVLCLVILSLNPNRSKKQFFFLNTSIYIYIYMDWDIINDHRL